MNKYSEERKALQEKGLVPEWLYGYCHERFEYSSRNKGLVIKTSGQWRGKVGDRPGHIRPDTRRIITIKYHSYFEHQLVWLMFNGVFPDKQIDHINLDPTDNRIENLRLATNQQNCCNRNLQSNSSTGYKGVSIRKDLRSKPFCAHIKKDGIMYNLGYYSSDVEAAKIYDSKAKELFGEFAKLNFEETYV